MSVSSSSSDNGSMPSHSSFPFPAADPLRNPLRHSSPLKRKHETAFPEEKDSVNKKINFEGTAFSPNDVQASLISKRIKTINLRICKVDRGITQHNYLNGFTDELKFQAYLIEQLLEEQNAQFVVAAHIRSELHRIANDTVWSIDRKLAEMGVVYFYMTTGKSLSISTSYLLDRSSEIIRNIREHKTHYLRATNDKETSDKFLSVGYIDYTLRTFARMVFTVNGAFNLGGCYAIKELLNRRFSLWITEALRGQILNVIDRLINDQEMRNIFETPFSVHPELQDIIRIDLKLPKEEEMNFIYVRWSLLIFLFSLVGQESEPNCFAIATLANLSWNHPRKY